MKTYPNSASGSKTGLIEKHTKPENISGIDLSSNSTRLPVTVFAFLIFAILNILSLLTLTSDNNTNSFKNTDKSLYRIRQKVFDSLSETTQSGSWPWWIARAYLNTKTPQIVTIGDSQINAAFFQADATVVGKPVDCAVDRSCPALKSALQQRAPLEHLHLVSLALGGAMPSDFYMISKALFTIKLHPKLVIIAVSPRSFLDSTLPSASSTEIFQFFSPFVKLENMINYAFSDPFQKYFWLIKNEFPLFACKQDIDSFAHELLEQHHLPVETRSLSNQNQLAQNKPLQSIYAGDGNVAKDVNMIGPFPFSIFLDNRQEYIRRFSHLKQQTYDDQYAYFSATLQYLKQLGVQVIVINMPMLKPVRDLLPSTVQTNYFLDLKKQCSSSHAYLLDLATSKDFPKHYFIDYVHLNAGGGKVLIDQLADFITNHDLLHSIQQNKNI